MLLKQCAILIAWTLFAYLVVEFLEGDVEETKQGAKNNEAAGFIYGHRRTARVVDLSNMDLERIDCISLEKFTNLQLLYLSSNKISEIEDDCFLFMKKLKYLDLSHNRLRMISKSAFAGLSSIEHLILTHNNISFIHDRAFQKTDYVHEQQLESTGYSHIRVYLANNPIYDAGLDENGVLTKFR